ncbi:hypothetical protein N7517_003924 [Penicillium concentricum]|uniref:Fungal N-terminal domain-containing protein n=1 Tax=Penicillium concentricum TaxID=293559 RepID=A0A9W9V7M5_9EURO|nr:uncharacterized protein N7517_003924 [Penicillium concentricum]KAJ5371918.1 hypothetical protein N7517_003924 [Penicillium concentricum]
MSGLEVVGIVASIVQVADLGAKISVKLCSFYRTVKTVNDSMRSLSSDVSLTCSVLHELGKALKQDSQTKLCSSGAFSTTEDVLKECREIFEKIDGEIEKRDQEKATNPLLRAAQKITLGFHGPDLDLLKCNLERLKSTMLLMLNVLMYAGQVRRRDLKVTLTDQRNLIQQLVEEKKENDTTFHQLSQPAPAVALRVEEPLQASTRALSIEPKPLSPHSTLPSPTEVKEYASLVRKLLSEIDTCHSSLEQSRVLRIRNGVANVHSMEVSLFQHTYGHSATRALHDPFFKFRDSCFPRPRSHTGWQHPLDLPVVDVAEPDVGHSSASRQTDTSTILNEDDDSAADIAPICHQNDTQLPYSRRYLVIETGRPTQHERTNYPIISRKQYKSPDLSQLGLYARDAAAKNDARLRDAKTVNRDVEELFLQWTTLTREEMEVDVKKKVDENK